MTTHDLNPALPFVADATAIDPAVPELLLALLQLRIEIPMLSHEQIHAWTVCIRAFVDGHEQERAARLADIPSADPLQAKHDPHGMHLVAKAV